MQYVILQNCLYYANTLSIVYSMKEIPGEHFCNQIILMIQSKKKKEFIWVRLASFDLVCIYATQA